MLKILSWVLISFLSTACGRSLVTVTPSPLIPPPITSTLFIPTAAPSPILPSATERIVAPYLFVTLHYFMAQLGADLSLSITSQTYLPTPPPFVSTLDIPDYYPPAVVFKDNSGRVLLKQFLQLVAFVDQMVIDAGLLAEWTIAVPNNSQYACVQLETPPSMSPADLKTSVESPLQIC